MKNLIEKYNENTLTEFLENMDEDFKNSTWKELHGLAKVLGSKLKILRNSCYFYKANDTKRYVNLAKYNETEEERKLLGQILGRISEEIHVKRLNGEGRPEEKPFCTYVLQAMNQLLTKEVKESVIKKAEEMRRLDV